MILFVPKTVFKSLYSARLQEPFILIFLFECYVTDKTLDLYARLILVWFNYKVIELSSPEANFKPC
jgi:hypothetical protein